MRIRIHKSYGFAGTDSVEYEDVPDDIAADPEKMKEWMKEQEEGHWDDMLQRLSFTVEFSE